MYLQGLRSLPDLDLEGRATAASYMCKSEAIYKQEVTDFLYVPKLYTARETDRFQEIASMTSAIFEKIIAHYLKDPDYRKHFGFQQELEELILIDPGYACAIPIIRIDIFYDEDTGDFKFCEFNTDGSSAMNEDREVSNALELTPSFKHFEQELASGGLKAQSFELFESWVDTFLDIYATYQNAVASPSIAICDFMDLSTPLELERFARCFAARGLQVEVCDIRDLRFDTDAADSPALLTPSGMKVDALYRRAVTGDIMKHYDEVSDFLEAYRAGCFALIGSFRTQLPHTKLSFEILHQQETLALLSPEEQGFVRTHVPFTARLTKALVAEQKSILDNKDAWIIKPLDSYGSKGVWAGREFDAATWESMISEACAAEDHIVQEYIEQYVADNLAIGFDLPAGKAAVQQSAAPEIQKYRDLTGLFVYAGQFKGLLARAGLQDRICAAAAGKTLGTFKIIEK